MTQPRVDRVRERRASFELALARAFAALLVASLLAVAIAPLAFSAHARERARALDDVIAPALEEIALLAATTAAQAALDDDEANARAAAMRERGAYRSLLPRLSRLDAETRAHVIAWRHALDRGALRAAVDESHAALRSLLTSARAEQLALRRMSERQALASSLLGALALASLAFALVGERRLRRLELTERTARARAELLSWVGHDMKNPLAALALAATNARRGFERDPARTRRALESIERSTQKLTRLVQELVDVARLDVGQAPPLARADVALADLVVDVARAVERARAEDAVRVDVALPAELPHVAGDAARLRQAMQLLVENAAAATPPGGAVSVRATAGAGELLVSVRDEGPGIDPAQLPALFDPFLAGGRGIERRRALGLALARGIAEGHGGRLFVESEAGKGATFTLVLPV